MPIAIQSLMLALVAACDVLIILDYDFWIDFSCKTSPADNRDKLRRREWERIRVIRRMSYLTIIVMGLILLITFMTLLGCSNVTENGALVDLSGHLGGWVSIIGYVFSLLALATSFWANTLNLRDIVNEQTKWGEKISWLAATLPCLVIALVGVQSFVGFTRMASVVQVLTGVGVIVAYNRSRKRAGTSLICGRLGSFPFQILAVAASLVASVGAVLTVTV